MILIFLVLLYISKLPLVIMYYYVSSLRKDSPGGIIISWFGGIMGSPS